MRKYCLANKAGFHRIIECQNITEARAEAESILLDPQMERCDLSLSEYHSDYEYVRAWYGENSDRTQAEFSDPIILHDGFFGDWEKRRIQ